MNGIINVYKEKGFTSFDAVAKLRGILKIRKIGHTGTLDPDAVGVLPVCIGNATRLCDMLTDKSKEYEAELLLGRTTDTQDISGQTLNEQEVIVSEEEVRTVVLSFTGDSMQIPPMYSALKVGGQKLCDLARKGIEVERQARPVTIYDITIEEIRLPVVRMKVACSKGTYIRTLCQDIGEKLGCGGCMQSLVRTRVSEFKLADAYTLSQIESLRDEGRLSEIIKPVDAVFPELMAITVLSSGAKMLDNGNKFRPDQTDLSQEKCSSLLNGEQFRVYNEAHVFCAIYEYSSQEKLLKPVRIFYVPAQEVRK